MEALNSLGIILGSSWTSGVNLYLTVAGLGIAHRLGWVALPGSMDVISNPLIIAVAVFLYLVEFVADKVPYVDSAWDSVHTFIRPVGGGALAYLGAADTGPVVQTALTMVSGAVTMDSHLAKAGTRAAINASPEPVTNSVASVSEDAVVVGSLWLMLVHPIVIGVLVILFVVFSIWFIPKLFRFVKKGFGYFFGKQDPKNADSG